MRQFLKSISVILVAAILLCACAMEGPKMSSWGSPKGLTKIKVFDAAIQAGGQRGMTTSASDRQSGTISFSQQRSGAATFTLNVLITEANGIVNVKTTGRYGSGPDGLAGVVPAGLQEKLIREFHAAMLQNLNISNPSEMTVLIEEMK